jgi:2-oxoglutarate ferredoxin oxidoreductase subunit delta
MATSTTDKRTGTTRRTRSWGEVRVFGRWCKGCGLCIAFCPSDVFEVDAKSHPHVRFPERCTGCEWCEIHCPDMAIEVIRHTETRASTES